MLRIQSSLQSSLVVIACGLALGGALGGCWRTTPAERAAEQQAGRSPTTGREAPRREPLSPQLVYSRIEAMYLPGLRRCYTAQLKKNATTAGRVVLTMTIGGTGKLTSRRAAGVGRAVEACVERAMARWDFPPARNGDGSAAEATFRLSLQLTAI